ncbi:MAG TPA: RsbRD N-terminal domain-containing protein [Polyangiaceae bacterium]|nr:RsbRD N-terminal domain-containing protein [Polyangiaceae bacterium]
MEPIRQQICDLLSLKRHEIVLRWLEQVRATLYPAVTRVELVDHMPFFLDELIAALRRDESMGRSQMAAEHGVQRLRSGFSLDSIIREYGALRDAIVAAATDSGMPLGVSETQVLFDCIVTSIAEAVSEYMRQRDAELQRQVNELQNTLSAAMAALTLLARKPELTDDPVWEALRRSLNRIRDLMAADFPRSVAAEA